MARDLYIKPTVPSEDSIAVRLGASGAAYLTTELGKFAKLSAESQFDLAAVGNKIEAVITAVELAPQNAFTVGAVREEGKMTVTFDGVEAGGAGAIAIGDYVVCGTAVAQGTALTVPPKVRKATNQPGTAIVPATAGADTAAAVKVILDAAFVKLADVQLNVIYAWRVVSLGTAGTGAVGTTGVIERCTA